MKGTNGIGGISRPKEANLRQHFQSETSSYSYQIGAKLSFKEKILHLNFENYSSLRFNQPGHVSVSWVVLSQVPLALSIIWLYVASEINN